MAKKIFSIVMAAVIAVTLSVTALADDTEEKNPCKTYVSARRQYARDFKAETNYDYGMAEIITAGIRCLRIDTGAAVSDGDLVTEKNSNHAEVYETVSYIPYSMKVRAFGSHSAYKNGQAVVFKFTQSEEAI